MLEINAAPLGAFPSLTILRLRLKRKLLNSIPPLLLFLKALFSFESMGRRSYLIDRYELARSLYVRVSVIEERR